MSATVFNSGGTYDLKLAENGSIKIEPKAQTGGFEPIMIVAGIDQSDVVTYSNEGPGLPFEFDLVVIESNPTETPK